MIFLLITFLVPMLESTMPPSDENVCGTSPVGLLNYAISVDSLEILHDSSSVSNTAHSAGKTQISLQVRSENANVTAVFAKFDNY